MKIKLEDSEWEVIANYTKDIIKIANNYFVKKEEQMEMLPFGEIFSDEEERELVEN